MSDKPQRRKPRLDPATREMRDRARTNKAAQTKKQKRDADRGRLRLDLPKGRTGELVRTALEIAAQGRGELGLTVDDEIKGTSLSQMGCFLILWALRDDDQVAAIEAHLADRVEFSKSLQIDVNLVLDDLLAGFTDSALGSQCLERIAERGH